MTDTAKTALPQLMACFEKVCGYLEEENSFLQVDYLTRVVEVLPRKQAAMQELESILSGGTAEGAAEGPARKDLLTPQIEKAVQRFNELANLNHQLLKKAVEVQSEIVSLILENVAQDQRTGYGASGHYTVNKEVSGAFTLSSDA